MEEMSGIEYFDKYVQEQEVDKKEEIIDDALECIKNQEERRMEALHDFIEDFIHSQEYSDYIKEKRNIMRRTTHTQCDADDILVECMKDKEIEKYPLTAEQQKMYAFKKNFEMYAERQQTESEIKKQERGIQVIKTRIQEARRTFDCTRQLREMEKEKDDQRLLYKYAAIFDIKVRYLGENAQLKLLDRFKRYQREAACANKRKRENVGKMMENLLLDHKIKKRLMACQREREKYQKRPREKIIKDMEIVGTKMELIDRKKPAILIKPEPPPPVKEPSVTELFSKKKKGKAVKGEDVAGKKKKEKKASEKKSTKGKKIKIKKSKVDVKLYLPTIPIINPREKVFPENIDQIVDIVEEFRELDNRMEDSEMMRHNKKNFLLEDSGLIAKPEEVLFQNFEEGKSYSRIIRISNFATQIKKMRFLKFEFPDDYDQVVFKVQNFGIRKLYTGSSINLRLKFEPYDTFKPYEGKAIFLSYDIRLCQYFQLEVGIKCVPKYSKLKIYPELIQFGSIPIWKAGNERNFKIIKLENQGLKPCTIYIKKIPDPLDLEPIFEEDNKENITPVPVNSPTDLLVIHKILDDCISNIDNNFQFQHSYFTLKPFEKRRVKIFFKNPSYVGYYFEKFSVDVYEVFEDGVLDNAGCQTVTLHAETSGHFLTTTPEILDFGTCVINSCYQLSFEIYNDSDKSQAVSVRIPSILSDVVQPEISAIYMSSKSRRTIFVKLNPKNSIIRDYCPYFDESYSILEFPIRVCVVSKGLENCPPVQVQVYAIVTTFEDLTISCSMNSIDKMSNFLNTLLVDMGEASIYETVWTDVYLTNNTAVPQICGFVNLPHSVTLEPQHGFCKLYPGQRKKFKLYLSPEIRDFPSFPIESLRNNCYFFKLGIETIFCLGKTTPEINLKRLKHSMDMVLQQMTEENSLSTSMLGVAEEIREHLVFNTLTQSMINGEGFRASRPSSFSQQYPDQSDTDIEPTVDIDTLLDFQNFLIFETQSRKEMWFKSNLQRPLVEFSHQMVEFPDTACGSYSVMEIKLHALEREIEKYCFKKKANYLVYDAYFQLLGGSEEIEIAPSRGMLTVGETTKLTLVAKPVVPKEIVEQTAKSIKYSELYELKLQEYLRRAKKHSKKEKTGKKTKNSKKGKKKTSDKKKDNSKTDKAIDTPNIVITDKELECDYLDLYPAEMVYWRSMEPYYIKANFTCVVDYEHLRKRRDRLFLSAMCKVIRPDFSTNLKTQRLDFGTCLVGMSKTNVIMAQNITYENIKPKISLLNPVGSFSVPCLKDVSVPPEHYLRLPVEFRPTSTKKVTEYFEIKSNATVIPLILCGEGSTPVINISPNFEVFRLETKQKKLAELQLKIENSSEAPAIVQFEKLFEIEALLVDINKKDDKVEINVKEDNTKTKKKESPKKRNKEKVVKYSDNLTSSELDAIQSNFKKTKGDSHFDLGPTKGQVNLRPKEAHTVTISCGEPEVIKMKKLQALKKGKKGEAKVAPTTRSSSVGSKTGNEDKQYITQFNLHIGEAHIKSILLICTIKC